MRVLAWILLLGCLLTGRAAAQEPESARFRIESIEVEGLKQASSRVVIGESRLKTGHEYSEQELREAVYRIKRLPFVLDAEFSLRKGSERGLYVLVVRVEETKPVFLSLGAQTSIDPDPVFTGLEERKVDTSYSASFGIRQFVGSSGELFVSTTDDLEVIDAGYTQYNLWGNGGFLSVGLKIDSEEPDQVYAGSLNLGIPIRGSHSLLFEYDEYRVDVLTGSAGNAARQKTRVQLASASWIYDTTDDPLFPSSGVKVRGTVSADRDETVREELDGRRTDFDTSSYGWTVTSQRFYSLKHHQVVSWNVQGGSYDLSPGARSQIYSIGAGLGYGKDLWEAARTKGWGDLRWNVTGDYGFRDTEVQEGSGFISRHQSIRLGTELLFRSAWGIAKWTLVYERDLENRR